MASMKIAIDVFMDGLPAAFCGGYVPFANSEMMFSVTLPVAATIRSWFPRTLRILEDRPLGQKTTSNPPPDGRMKVEVWSSNAASHFNIRVLGTG